MFLQWRRHRSRKSAISKIPSYINPAQKHEARKHVLEATPTAPIPQCHSPAGFLKQKAYVFVSTQPPESNLEAPGPGHPKHEAKKTRVGGDSRSPPAPQCRSPARFLKQKAYVFACTQIPEPNPPAQGSGPRLHGPRAQASLGPGPKPQPSGHRAQAPSSKIWCPLPGARRTCRKLIKSEWLRCAQRRAIFWLWLQSKARSSIVAKHAPLSNNE